MNSSIYRFTLDLHCTQSQISIPALIGDTGRTLRISFSDGGKPYIIPDRCIAKLSIKRPTGTRLEDFCVIEDHSTAVYKFEQNENTVAVEGIHNCDITLYDTDGRSLASPRFTMIVSERVVRRDDIVITDEDLTAANAMVKEEAVRQTNEALRISSESTRQTNEEGRVSAEKLRASEENSRSQSESQREEAELKRVIAEALRVSKDEERDADIQSAVNASEKAAKKATEALEKSNLASADVEAFRTEIGSEALATGQPTVKASVNFAVDAANVAKNQATVTHTNLINLSAQVQGIGRSYVIPDFLHFIDFLNSNSYVELEEDRDGDGVNETYHVYISDIKTGDNIIIVEKGVPDFWFEKNSALSEFESYSYNNTEYTLSATADGIMIGGAHILETDYTVIEGHAVSAAASAKDAEASAGAAKSSENSAKGSAEAADASKLAAEEAEESAAKSAEEAKASKEAAEDAEANAKTNISNAEADALKHIEKMAAEALNIVQNTGRGKTVVMSQDATTKAIAEKTEYDAEIEENITDSLTINADQYWHSNGSLINNMSSYACTDLIPVNEGDRFKISVKYGFATPIVVEFDDKNTAIGYDGFNEGGNAIAVDYEYAVPSGVSSIGVNTRDQKNYPIVVKKIIKEDVKRRIVINEANIAGLNDAIEDVSSSDETKYGARYARINANRSPVSRYNSTDEEYATSKGMYDLLRNVDDNGGMNPTAIKLLIEILKAGTYGEDVSKKIEALENSMLSATLKLLGGLDVGTYTLKYEGTSGVLTDHLDICSFTLTSVGQTPVYSGFITENVAPQNATTIGVYDSSNERVGEIPLTSLSHAFETKQYTFAAISDVHIGQGDSVEDFTNVTAFFDADESIEFAAICGDCVDNATITSQLETYQSVVANVQTPIYIVTGNHEAVNLANAGKSYDDVKAYFKQNAHPNINQELYYTFEKNNDVFIMVGCYGNFNYDETFSDDEIQWLYETLEENRNKRCFLFLHYFPQDGSGDAVNCYSSDGLKGLKGSVFYNLVKHYKNVIYFHGHSHAKFKVQELNGLNTIDREFGRYSVHIPSLMWPTYPDAEGDGYVKDSSAGEGYIIDVYDSGIHLKGRDFENNQYSPLGSYWLDTTLQEVKPRTFYDATGIIKNENTTSLKAGATWYEGTLDKSNITKISFVEKYVGEYDEVWCPTIIDNGNVTAYRLGTDVFVSGGGVNANRDSSSMFAGFTALTEIKGLWRLNVSHVTSITSMFDGCSSLKSLFLSGFDGIAPTDMANVFRGCTSIRELDISGFNLDGVQYWTATFNKCSSLEAVYLPQMYSNKGIYLNTTFGACSALKSIDLSRFPDNLNLGSTFAECTSLKHVRMGYKKPISMGSTFYKCALLESVDFSSVDASQISNMASTFYGCNSLTRLILPEVFDTSKVTTMENMFSGCKVLTLDCSEWANDSLTNIDNFNKDAPNVIAPSLQT